MRHLEMAAGILLGITLGVCLPVGMAFGWECAYPTSGNMSATPAVVCYGSGTSHTIAVNATDLDGIKKITITYAGNTLKTCTYSTPYPTSATCTTTWSSSGADPGTYSIFGAVYDRCGTSADWISNANVYVLGGPIVSDCPYVCDTMKMRVTCPASASPSYPFEPQYDQPTGTSYLWTIISGADKAHIVGPNNEATVYLKGDAGGTGTLQCRFRKGGVDCYETKQFRCQVPNQGNSTRAIGALTVTNGPPLWTMERLVTYTVKDQGGQPICRAEWNETPWNMVGPGCGNINADDDAVTNASGKLNNQWQADRFWWSQGQPWDGASNICQWTQTIKVDGCPSGANFWTNAISFTQAPSITVTPQ